MRVASRRQTDLDIHVHNRTLVFINMTAQHKCYIKFKVQSFTLTYLDYTIATLRGLYPRARRFQIAQIPLADVSCCQGKPTEKCIVVRFSKRSRGWF